MDKLMTATKQTKETIRGIDMVRGGGNTAGMYWTFRLSELNL